MTEFGRILQFDAARGYGFIAPDRGGADVFVHVNECEGDQSRFIPGARVRFEVMDGDRGKKAYCVGVVAEATSSGNPAEHDEDSEFCDVLTIGEMRATLTDMLLRLSPELTGSQIVRLRDGFLALARERGWVEG
ncbi:MULTISPECIES: cold-shock protein [Actinomadura]|uniref:cold-shock protein n=1 Tax=Actinomadura TaxID=1988 RepID=UPI000425599B|nr:cold shock domain-containing protein [Actinomadura madurae]